MNKDIILASSSPRRIELLTKEGFNIQVIPAHIEEKTDPNLGPEDTVISLALQKTQAVADSADNPTGLPVIGADTIVYLNKIIGKPKDRDDALNILMELSGKEHQVYTGVAILKPGDGKLESTTFAEKTSVWFKDYSLEDISDYLDSEEPYDKAGAYAIQGYFSRFIDHIDGDYDNVMGLPVTALLKHL